MTKRSINQILDYNTLPLRPLSYAELEDKRILDALREARELLWHTELNGKRIATLLKKWDD